MNDFYREQQIALTGATGFLGKIILHQLLKTDVRKVFLLVRSRGDQSPYKRVQALFAEEPFERPMDPRVEVIESDITKSKLGLSAEDGEYLRRQVTVFINNAASVSFENELQVALEKNVLSTLETILLLKSWPRLKCFVYVSTAFSNCTVSVVPEKVHPHTFVSLENVLRRYDTDPASLSEWDLQGHPNTYTFSKQQAEALVASSGLPHVIVRPPVIVGSLEDPKCGWVDNFNGYNAVFLLSKNGQNPPLYADRKCSCALAPVDICANVILGAAWRRTFRPDNLVYNCSCSQTAPKFAVMFDTYIEALKDLTPPRYLRTTSNRFCLWIVFIGIFLIPAFFAQLYAILTGSKERPLRKVLRSRARCAMMEYFTTKKIVFEYKNVRELAMELSDDERNKFKMDLSGIEWPSFLHKTAKGVLRYAEIAEERKKAKRKEAAVKKL